VWIWGLPRRISWSRIGAAAIPTIAGIILALYLQFIVFGPPEVTVEPAEIIEHAEVRVQGKNVFLEVIVNNPTPYEMYIVNISIRNMTLSKRNLPSPDNPTTVNPGSRQELIYFIGGSSLANKLKNIDHVVIQIRYRVGDLFNSTVIDAPVLHS